MCLVLLFSFAIPIHLMMHKSFLPTVLAGSTFIMPLMVFLCLVCSGRLQLCYIAPAERLEARQGTDQQEPED